MVQFPVFAQLDYIRNLIGFIKRTEIVESTGLAYTAFRFIRFLYHIHHFIFEQILKGQCAII